MLKNILYILYKFLKLFDAVFIYLLNKSFLISLRELIEKDSYKTIKINKKNIIFFIPNQLTKWRVDTFFSKEPETLKWIDNFSDDKNCVFWDIGANIGLYSIYAAIKKNNCKIISFEPSTSNLRLLSRNISINNLNDKIKIFTNPLSNKNKFLNMNEPSFIEGGALNTFGENFDFKGDKLESTMHYQLYGNTINFLLDNKIVDMPNYLKIDVDGIEHLILEGGNNYLLDKNLLGICIEINENFEDQHKRILNILNKNKFYFSHKENTYLLVDRSSHFSKSFNYFFIKN